MGNIAVNFVNVKASYDPEGRFLKSRFSVKVDQLGT
jgi:hypothetical protein